MSVRKLILWWLGVSLLILLYAGLDAYYNPEVTRTTLGQISFTPDPEWSLWEALDNVRHAGGRLWGALGGLQFTFLTLFISGFVVAILSLFHKDDSNTPRSEAERTTVLPPL